MTREELATVAHRISMSENPMTIIIDLLCGHEDPPMDLVAAVQAMCDAQLSAWKVAQSHRDAAPKTAA